MYSQFLFEEGLMQFLSDSMPVRGYQVVEEGCVGGSGAQ